MQDVTLRVVRGAVLKLRATNVDRQRIPFAQLSLLDSRGKPVVSSMSTFTVMRRLMGNRNEVADSGWYEFGSVPPDTYTAVIAEPGKEELRITRTIADGETVEWEVDVTAELAARGSAKKQLGWHTAAWLCDAVIPRSRCGSGCCRCRIGCGHCARTGPRAVG